MATKVTVSRAVLAKLKSHAKACWPKESYAILLGESSSSLQSYRVTDAYIPDNVMQYSTKSWVSVQMAWWDAARLYAIEHNLSILGDVHSHTYSKRFIGDHAPSEVDWHRALPKHNLHAVMLLQELRSGRKRASIKFWPVIDPIECQIT